MSELDQKNIDRDIETRQKLENELQDRINECISFGLANYTIYSAADLAWDSAPINKQIYPLMLYAQGKISVEGCAKELDRLKCANQFVKKDSKTGEITGIDLPRFYETTIHLVRSIITRRVAAQSNKYQSLYPYYQYEPRSTSLKGKLRADVLSQRVDIMSDQFDYRHHDIQCLRDAFRYGHCVDFVRSRWEKETQWVQEERGDVETNGEIKKKAAIVREGVGWINPHPTRTFWDNNYPLISLNTDTGCEYVGFWDIVRYKDILDNASYFNRSTISYGPTLWGIYSTYTIYFGQFFCNLKPPCNLTNIGSDLSSPNDRKANIGVYDGEKREMAVFLTQYFKKLIPKDYGCGDYPFPIWVRFTTASDATIVYVEIMPSTPGAVLSYNEDDNRQLNISFAHELMPFQDQMTNLVTNMLLTLQKDLLTIVGMNNDMMEDEVLKAARAQLGGKNYAATPLIIEYSLNKLKDMGINAKEVCAVFEAKASGSITTNIQAQMQLLLLVERMVALSPNEQGQPAPREISATETNEIANTTSTVYSFISDAVDEFRGGKKRIIYESLIACADREIRVPVKYRYTEKTIKDAGFTFEPDEDEDPVRGELRARTILGSKSNLVYEYIFSSRDGAERPSRVQAANTLVQLLAVLQNPLVLQKLGKEKFYSIINEIFRLSGTGIDLNLEVAEGEPDNFGIDVNQQVQELLSKLAQASKVNSEQIAELSQKMEMAEPLLQTLAKATRRNSEMIMDDRESASTAGTR